MGITDAEQVAVGDDFACALQGAQAVCWGDIYTGGAADSLGLNAVTALGGPPQFSHPNDFAPVLPREEPYRVGEQMCREYYSHAGAIFEFCLDRPAPPCELIETGVECRAQGDCAADEVCWFARCVGAPEGQPGGVGACFEAVVELDYGGAAPDRVYNYSLAARPMGSEEPLHRADADYEWREPQLQCHNGCSVYSRGYGDVMASSSGLDAYGDEYPRQMRR